MHIPLEGDDIMWRRITRQVNAISFASVLVVAMTVAGCATSESHNWRNKLAAELPELGHRNWIVIADSAYPAQSRPGIETIATGASHIEVVKTAVDAINNSGHVRANVYLDAEMKYVSEEDAPGIDAYRKKLGALLGKDNEVTVLAHEELIAKLDEAAKTFRVLILKSKLTLPYTSVFLELDCGYWSPEAEHRLRQAIERTK